MTKSLIVHQQQGALSPRRQARRKKVQALFADAYAPNTRRAYSSDLKQLAVWLVNEGEQPWLPLDENGELVKDSDGNAITSPFYELDPVLFAEYLTVLVDEGRKASTIGRTVAAVGFANESRGWMSPSKNPGVKKTIKGIRRRLRTRPRKKDPIRYSDLERMFAFTEDNLTGVRNRALLSLGLGGGFRRDELVGLDVPQVTMSGQYVDILLLQSKGDKEGAGVVVRVPRIDGPCCAHQCVARWIAEGEIKEGPLFRNIRKGDHLQPDRLTGQSVANIIKQLAGAAGIEADLAGHSLRRGFAKELEESGATLVQMQQAMRHASADTTAGYLEASETATQVADLLAQSVRRRAND